MIFQDLVSGRRMLIYIFPGHIQAGEKTPKETELPATHKLDIDLLWLISWCYFGSNLFLFLFFFQKKLDSIAFQLTPTWLFQLFGLRVTPLQSRKGINRLFGLTTLSKPNQIYASLNLTPLTHYSTHQTDLSHTFCVDNTTKIFSGSVGSLNRWECLTLKRQNLEWDPQLQNKRGSFHT